MKRDEIEVGKTYLAKVSGTVVPVLIERERSTVFHSSMRRQHGGWDAVNCVTHRAVLIRSAARLRRPYVFPLRSND